MPAATKKLHENQSLIGGLGGPFRQNAPRSGGFSVEVIQSAVRLAPAQPARLSSARLRYSRQAGVADASSCLAFFKRIDDPVLQISGFSCQGDRLPVRRAAVGCMLDRLTLLTSGNDPKLAEMFAHAELKRAGCAGTSLTADWMTRLKTRHAGRVLTDRTAKAPIKALVFMQLFCRSRHLSTPVWPD